MSSCSNCSQSWLLIAEHFPTNPGFGECFYLSTILSLDTSHLLRRGTSLHLHCLQLCLLGKNVMLSSCWLFFPVFTFFDFWDFIFFHYRYFHLILRITKAFFWLPSWFWKIFFLLPLLVISDLFLMENFMGNFSLFTM